MDIGYQLEIVNHTDQELHFHPEVEIIYVIEGKAEIEVDKAKTVLGREEIFLVNFAKSHKVFPMQDSLIAALKFDYPSFLKVTGKTQCVFACNTSADDSRSHYNLRKHFTEMLRCHLIGDRILQEKCAFYALLDCLVSEYVVQEYSGKREKENERMEQVLLYISMHYAESISLTDICERFYYATSTFTRNFKKATGMSFVQYLTYIRVHYAKEDLMNTKKSVTQAAADHGFSDLAVFNKVFKKVYGVSPTGYKKREESGKQKAQGIDLKSVKQEFMRDAEMQKQEPERMLRRVVHLNSKSHHPYRKVWNLAVGIGSASDLLAARLQKQICMLRDEVGYQYVRLPHIFSDAMKIRPEEFSDELNFDYVDSVLDFMVENGLKPILEIGDIPKVVMKSRKEILYVEGEKPFFKDLEDFRFVTEKFVRHIMRRFGAEMCRDWIWEVTYDYGAASDTKSFEAYISYAMRGNLESDFLERYKIMRNAVRRWIPGAKVGGYGIKFGEIDREFLEKWFHGELRPDFLSVSAYPYEKQKVKRADVKYARSMNPHFMQERIREIKKVLCEMHEESMPLYLTEWNLSRADRSSVNDSGEKGAKMLRFMAELLEEVDMGVYDLASDTGSRYYETDMPLFGGRGLVSKEGLPKPAFYALSNFHFAGNELIKKGDNFIFTSHGQNLLFGLCYNDKNFNIHYYNKAENEIVPEDLEVIYENEEGLELHFIITGLQDGIYCLKRGLYNEKNGLLQRWLAMGGMDGIDFNDYEYLRKNVCADIFVRRLKVTDGELEFSIKMEAHEMNLLNIYPIELEISDGK